MCPRVPGYLTDLVKQPGGGIAKGQGLGYGQRMYACSIAEEMNRLVIYW